MFKELFIDNSKCIVLSIAAENANDDIAGIVGGSIPAVIAQQPNVYGITTDYVYFLTIGSNLCEMAYGKKNIALSIFYKKDYDELLLSNNSIVNNGGIIAIAHKISERFVERSVNDAVFPKYNFQFSMENSKDYEDEEVTKIGGLPNFIQDDSLHKELKSKGYLLLFTFFERTMRKCDGYDEYQFANGAFYVYGKYDESSNNIDLYDTKVYWQNS